MVSIGSMPPYGNSTESKTVNGTTAAIGAQTEYDENGNYALRSYDARGKEVVRSIDPDDYTLTSVTDPDGQAVSYTYDGAKRVIGVETTVGTGDEAVTYKNAYTYENNRIKTVAHNTEDDNCDVVYRFEYDALGRKTSVKVGNAAAQNQVLSTNVYSGDRSGLLEEVQYGNGGKVKYAYDGFDRLEGVSYDDETDPRYSYIYDATGEVAKVVDNHLNRSVETERDLAFRPRQSTLKDAEGNVLYRTTLYYDKMNRLEKFAENVDGEAHTSTYNYDKDNRTTEIKYDYVAPETEGEEAPCDKVAYTYDDEFEMLWPKTYAEIGKCFGGKSVINLAKQEGDLQFVCTDSDTTRSNKITHVTMVASDSKIVHARSTKYGVRTDSISLYSGKICAVTRYDPSCDLRIGMCGWRTLELQKALNANDANITEDGEFGSNTQTTVKEYQKAHGMEVTGIADAELLKQLQMIENEQEEQKQEADGALVRVTGNSVNLRTGPGTEYESVGIVHKGDQLRKVDTEGWSAVERNGHLYWISDHYVSK